MVENAVEPIRVRFALKRHYLKMFRDRNYFTRVLSVSRIPRWGDRVSVDAFISPDDLDSVKKYASCTVRQLNPYQRRVRVRKKR